MKLLLTSGGVNTRSIAASLHQLVDMPVGQAKVGVIPTAANAENRNKDWYINQFLHLWRHGFNWIDIIDPSAAGIDDWRERLDAVDIVFVSGGNTFHLLNQMRETGLDTWLRGNIDKKVYVGSSAGTLVATPTIDLASMPPGDPNVPKLKDLTGLKFVDFEIEPHCDAGRFAAVEKYAQTRQNPVYAIDDLTAIQVVDSKVEVISEGTWQVYGKH